MTKRYKPDDLLTVEEVAAALNRSAVTVWVLARDHNIPRYRLPARGKVTFFRWGDIERVLETRIPVHPAAPS